MQAQIIGTASTKQQKRYAPFTRGMRGEENKGVGANVMVCRRDDTSLKKFKGSELVKSVSGVRIFSFQKTDGERQTVRVFENTSGNYRVRFYDEDGTEVIPATDRDYTDTNFDFVQLGTQGYFTSGSIYYWDGSDFTALTNSPTNIKGLALDGYRLACITTSGAEFSRGDINTTNNWTGGTGELLEGTYNTNISRPSAIVSSSVGVIIMDENGGAELHKVRAKESSQDVSSDTKLETFVYTGLGVDSQKKLVMGDRYLYALNEDGIAEINPISGEAVDITEAGKIKRYLANANITNAKLAYHKREKLLMCLLSNGTQNDTLFMVDTKRQSRDVIVLPRQYYNDLVDHGNFVQMIGNTQIDRVFTNTYVNQSDESRTFRYITEFDDFGNPFVEKIIRAINIFVTAKPETNFEISAYINGSTEPLVANSFTTSTNSVAGDTVAVYGKYVLGLGDPISSNKSDRIERNTKSFKCNTLAIEVKQVGVNADFQLHDIMVEFKGGRITNDVNLQNNLFTL